MNRGGERRAHPRVAKGGFTLVELIISMGILAALIGLVVAVILTAFSNYDRGARLTDAKQKTQAIYTFCQQNLAEATAVYIGSVPAGSTAEHVIEFKDGRLFFGSSSATTEDLYGENFYAGCEVRVSVYCSRGDVVHLTVELWDPREGKVLYKREGAFRLSGLSLLGKTVHGAPSEAAPASNPVIYFSS